jgi:hypothetical protein
MRRDTALAAAVHQAGDQHFEAIARHDECHAERQEKHI